MDFKTTSQINYESSKLEDEKKVSNGVAFVAFVIDAGSI